MTTTAGEQRTHGGSRWKTWALVASLALNLLFIGAVSSAAWRLREAGGMGPPAAGLNLLGFTSSLPRERRSAIWMQTAADRHALQPLRAEVQRARQDVRGALAREPYDAAAFAQAQDHLLDAEIRSRKEAQRLFATIAASLTPEERKAFARWQPQQHHRPGWWWRRQGMGGAGRDAEQVPSAR